MPELLEFGRLRLTAKAIAYVTPPATFTTEERQQDKRRPNHVFKKPGIWTPRATLATGIGNLTVYDRSKVP